MSHRVTLTLLWGASTGGGETPASLAERADAFVLGGTAPTGEGRAGRRSRMPGAHVDPGRKRWHLKSIRAVLARAVVAGVLVASLTVVTPAASLATTTTTITFDDLAPGTKVSNQYDARGPRLCHRRRRRDERRAGANIYCYPVVAAVARRPSGVREPGRRRRSCANGEFPDTSIRGNLQNSAQSVSVYAGFAPTVGQPAGGRGGHVGRLRRRAATSSVRPR